MAIFRKMKENLCLKLVLAFALFFTACKKENRTDCFKSNGKETKERRNVGEFDEVEIEDKMDVEITYGKEHSVEISAGSHLLSNISTVVSDGVLKIENRNTCNFVRGYKRTLQVTITMPYLHKVVHKGVGPIHIHDMDQDSISLRAENSGDIYLDGNFKEVKTSSHGNGDMYLNGTTNSLMIYSFGTNYTRGENMVVASYIYIETYSIGDAHLKLGIKTGIDYKIGGKGNVYYSGEPVQIRRLNPEDTGGSLIKE